jgi:glycosyltransferase involved in cell wall biosynthesis
MKISIVIPTLNEEALITKILEPLKGYEVIIVDGGSHDRTVSLAKKMGAKVIVAEGLNIPESRNLGSSLASGDLLIQLDADTFIDKDDIGLIESLMTESTVWVARLGCIRMMVGGIIKHLLLSCTLLY